MSDPVLAVIVGPTASGKSALALDLAERLKGEIVNCDSVAVYREFEIGTAKPSREERERVPHHLIDIASPSETVTAGDFSRLGRAAIRDISSRDLLPIVAGGTGFYLRALLEGLFPGPPRSEELRRRLRERASERGAGYLHRLLRRRDPAAALSIHENDLPKVIRALEISISARAPMTGLWQQGRDPLHGFHIIRIGLNPEREMLYARINQRAREMFAAGLVEETRTLAARYGDAAWPLNSLGYKQAMQHLRGHLTLEEAIAAAQQGHRNYAKRQMTWFRREADVLWFAGFGSDPGIQKAVAEVVATAAATPIGRPREGG
ncbi:MAG TPA: tRNA (adenosine(37)-N6)-dimethylallyltransferase MiaA [Candidatus Angelobacter sp.]|nr:tRNA (adenosine(37)-N6)-dimethylallyltransferase MiaA [Candidatus Angelobacter sp.]